MRQRCDVFLLVMCGFYWPFLVIVIAIAIALMSCVRVLLQLQFEEEENLAKQQEDTLRTNLKKYELMESVNIDRSLHKLTNHYGIKYRDD